MFIEEVLRGVEHPLRDLGWSARVPIALIAAYPEGLHFDVIGVDNRSGTRAAVCHLIEQHGRTRLFYIAGPAQAPEPGV